MDPRKSCHHLYPRGIQERQGAKVQREGSPDHVSIASSGNVASEIRKLTCNRGADLAFEAVGITPAIQTAMVNLSEEASWFNRLYNKEKGLLIVILKP